MDETVRRALLTSFTGKLDSLHQRWVMTVQRDFAEQVVMFQKQDALSGLS
jgi:hypothetical protein